MDKITAVIPVRKGSKRCLNKNTRDFYNTNLLELRINILKQVEEIDSILVSSECDEILEIAKKNNVDFVKRDKKYSNDECSGNDLYKCIAESCQTGIIIYAYVTSPFITALDYKRSIEMFRNNRTDAVYSMSHIKEFMFFENKPLNFDGKNIKRSQDLPKYYNATH
jgi:CMP-N-acetylneuraminic acid synthetase